VHSLVHLCIHSEISGEAAEKYLNMQHKMQTKCAIFSTYAPLETMPDFECTYSQRFSITHNIYLPWEKVTSAGWKKVFLGLFTIEISHFTFMQMQQINNEKIIKDGIQMWPKRWGKCSVSGNLRAEKVNI